MATVNFEPRFRDAGPDQDVMGAVTLVAPGERRIGMGENGVL